MKIFEGCVVTKRGAFECPDARAMLRRVFDRAEAASKQSIVMFVHGGGWDKAKGVERAAEVRDGILKGLRYPCEPLYLIWQPTIANALCAYPQGAEPLLRNELATIKRSDHGVAP